LKTKEKYLSSKGRGQSAVQRSVSGAIIIIIITYDLWLKAPAL
jgi:hypothetical protein